MKSNCWSKLSENFYILMADCALSNVTIKLSIIINITFLAPFLRHITSTHGLIDPITKPTLSWTEKAFVATCTASAISPRNQVLQCWIFISYYHYFQSNFIIIGVTVENGIGIK